MGSVRKLSMLFSVMTRLHGYLVDCVMCLPNYGLLLAFAARGPLRKTIGPCDVGNVTYFVVITLYEGKPVLS